MPENEVPRAEPEIIPPGHPGQRSMRDDFDVHGTQRIYVTRLGPLDVIVLALLIAFVAALTLIVLLGAVLFWIPAVVLLVAAAVVSKLLRRSSAEVGLARPSAQTTDAARDERAPTGCTQGQGKRN